MLFVVKRVFFVHTRFQREGFNFATDERRNASVLLALRRGDGSGEGKRSGRGSVRPNTAIYIAQKTVAAREVLEPT